jgi:AcrR family transcriptional regulator
MLAAREVFVAQGFSNSGIADIVDRADSSVGSLYHHFGGKAELYVALWQEHVLAFEEISRKEVASARQRGVADPTELFLSATRAHLVANWLSRDLAMLFFTDGPPGFEDLRRRTSRKWLAKNDALLGLSETTFEHLYAVGLLALINEGVREVVVSKTRRQANLVMDGVIEYARRIMAKGPWIPPADAADVVRPAPVKARRPAGEAGGSEGHLRELARR